MLWHHTPVLLPGKSHGRRSLEGCSPWGRWGSDMTEQLHFHFSLSCIGEGNGYPLHCSCLENPRDGGAWWAPESMGSHRVGHDWSDSAAAAAAADAHAVRNGTIQKNLSGDMWATIVKQRTEELAHLHTIHWHVQFTSVQFSHSIMSDSLRLHELQHTRPPCPSPSPRVHSNSRSSSQWCHPAISSSVVPFSSGPNPSQHQSLFQWVNSSHEVAKILEFWL